jgi:hypothetical protein
MRVKRRIQTVVAFRVKQKGRTVIAGYRWRRVSTVRRRVTFIGCSSVSGFLPLWTVSPKEIDVDFVSVLGVVAALCSVISFTPQAIKIVRTGETKDLSAVMYVLTEHSRLERSQC